jgi:superfamily II RNA helicase
MVKICSTTEYPLDNESKYKGFFEKYDYPLHIFQKWAIEGIVERQHVLVACPTGSGKTLPGEFALDFFHSIGKKTIYCSPIKALSNQKFYDFTNKYPHISIGLITGDIKCNTSAEVLIMTTEILLNKLYQIKSKNQSVNSSISFEMDIYNELGCVVFDEIHMINDESRGHVWENSIMLLPSHIQIIGLSATLDNPEKFSQWLESKGDDKKEKEEVLSKSVYLCTKKERAVPLTHYSFITVPNGIFKVIKDKAVQEEIKSMINKPFVIQSAKGVFDEQHYYKMTKMLNLFETNNIRVKRHHAINQLAKYLFENNMTPALCYVFSRKQLEICAKEMNTEILEDDSKVRYIVQKECEQIIRKLPNFEEYLYLPEYVNLVNLLAKGVAIHHSGMMPILREIVELLFMKGYVKLLFCTETVAIGLNLPVKTTIFTDINKHDGTQFRTLHGHEYTQAAGRAGRLGLDTVGHVIHLNNLFRDVNCVNYKQMMKGTPQTLVSKFKISYNLVLNLIDIGDTNFVDFTNRSMIKESIDNEAKIISDSLEALKGDIEKLSEVLDFVKTPRDTIWEYLQLIQQRTSAVNKKRKEIDRKITQIKDNYTNIENDKLLLEKYNNKIEDFDHLNDFYNATTNYTSDKVNTIVRLLSNEGFVEREVENVPVGGHGIIYKKPVSDYFLTPKGKIASQLREIHCLVFANLIDIHTFDELSAKQLVSILSCFTNITVSDELKSLIPSSDDKTVQNIIVDLQSKYHYYKDKEVSLEMDTGVDYNLHYDLINYVRDWCDCDCVEDCKFFLQNLEKEKQIFLGEFIKALLKINNISNEFEKIAELTGNVLLLSKLKEIPALTLKYVATNQSLYV